MKKHRKILAAAVVFTHLISLSGCYNDGPPKVTYPDVPSVTDEDGSSHYEGGSNGGNSGFSTADWMWFQGVLSCSHGTLSFHDASRKTVYFTCDDALAQAVGLKKGGEYEGTYSLYEIFHPNGHMDAPIGRASHIGLYVYDAFSDQKGDPMVGDIPLRYNESNNDRIGTDLEIDGEQVVFLADDSMILDGPPKEPDTPAPDAHDGLFVSEHGTLEFNGDGKSITINLDEWLCKRCGLPPGEQHGEYEFMSGEMAPQGRIDVRYDMAQAIAIYPDGMDHYESMALIDVGEVSNGEFHTGTGCTTADRITFQFFGDEWEYVDFLKQ
ncbi:MAG: hypothetical protein IK096_00670 [Lachnospiraceae bacterium]|nr:hypothetical protein [Lachnospiraceae bacterium]